MDSPRGAAVKAEDFGLKGPRGWVFRGIGIDAAPGSLIAVEGPSGSGRTCLLLALTGRMKATEGRARVGGHDLPKRMTAVRATTALGPVTGVNELDPSLTVAEQLREGALLRRRYGGPVRALLRSPRARAAATAARIDAAVAAAGLDVDGLPKGMRTSVRDLERLEELRLSLAIALLGDPGLIAVDDADLKLSDAERAEAWALLRGLAAAGTTVLAVCSQAPADALVLRTGTTDRAPGGSASGKPASAAFAPAGSGPARSRRRSRPRPAAGGNPKAPAESGDTTGLPPAGGGAPDAGATPATPAAGATAAVPAAGGAPEPRQQSTPAPAPAAGAVEPGGSTAPAHPEPSGEVAPGAVTPAADPGAAEASAETADSGVAPADASRTEGTAPADATTPTTPTRTDDTKEAADAHAEARRA